MALDMTAAQASYFGDLERAQALAAEERAIAERLGDPYHLAIAVMRQAWSAADHRECRAFADEAIPMLRRCGNLHGIAEISVVLLESGSLRGATLQTRPCRSPRRACGGPPGPGEPFALGLHLGNTGLAALFLQRVDTADRLMHEQIEILRRARIDGLWDEPALMLACVAAHHGELDRAATFFGFSQAVPSVPPARRRARDPRPAASTRTSRPRAAPSASARGDARPWPARP